MSKKIYWNLLVLFGILCHGIIGTLSEKDIDESSELLVREKRVINRFPGGDLKEDIRKVPYVVTVKPYRVNYSCVGVILTNLIVLTIAKCVELEERMYRVYSDTSKKTSHGHYVSHNVTNKRTFFGNHPFRPADGIALITVNPPFVFSPKTKNIELYEGRVQPGHLGMVSGWGCHAPPEHPGTTHQDYLRSIIVPIISNHDCTMLYIRNFAISDSDICTLDATGNQYCSIGDAGAPLAIKENNVYKLLGVHLWNGAIVGQSNPDVFVNLQNPRCKTWIIETIHSLEAHVHGRN